VKAWKAALAASVATAAIALIMVAPMAQSSKRHGGLKIVSVVNAGISSDVATAKCPQGFVAIAGGFEGQGIDAQSSEKQGERRWTVTGVASSTKRGQLLRAQAICAKGTGGFRVNDVGKR
jgi:hypothetical protein